MSQKLSWLFIVFYKPENAQVLIMPFENITYLAGSETSIPWELQTSLTLYMASVNFSRSVTRKVGTHGVSGAVRTESYFWYISVPASRFSPHIPMPLRSALLSFCIKKKVMNRNFERNNVTRLKIFITHYHLYSILADLLSLNIFI